jgi:cell wall-associated NlpC family hydrolase
MACKFLDLIGTPYVIKDCWAIVVEFYSLELNIELKHYYSEVPNDRDIANSLIYSSMGDFDKVERPEYGDIILMKFRGVESHIGVYLGNGKMLHTTQSTDCVVESLVRWEKLVTGFYRVKSHDKV